MATTRKATKKMGARKIAAAGDRGGFTIIEVVLVLAIAGLIFLMVFIALPALQRSQRDTQRRERMGDLQTAITNYQGNNNGKLPQDGSIASYSEDDTAGTDMSTWCTSNVANSSTPASSPAACLIKRYLVSVNAQHDDFLDPTGNTYGITIMTLSKNQTHTVNETDYNNHMAYVIKHATCNGEESVYSPNSRDYTIMLRLEGNGIYCQGNGS